MCTSTVVPPSADGERASWPIGLQLPKSWRAAQESANETVKSLVLKGRGTVGSVRALDYDSVETAIRRATTRSIDSLKKLGDGSSAANGLGTVAKRGSSTELASYGELRPLHGFETQVKESRQMLRRKQEELQKHLGWKDEPLPMVSKTFWRRHLRCCCRRSSVFLSLT